MSYHHGNLRQTLLDTARQLLNERGIDSFTLREVARQAGVSHAASYHHFADKAALVSALALESYTELARVLRQARTESSGTSIEQAQAVGTAYIYFALNHANEFRFMFRPELRQARQQEANRAIEAAAEGVDQILVESIRACQEVGEMVAGDTEALATTAWATVHGLAVLLLDGPLHEMLSAPAVVEQLISKVMRTLLHGLAA